ncbi:MAG: aromatic ring-hydroxylating dioxygenase subunit alpha [Gammaproteobacteria bacterium]|nr:aromatic ring-hydroxylating dioxygenase subunit alpha [Gammaproteobacteria bacterium]
MSSTNFAFDPLRALPAVTYRDQAWMDVEIDRIWRDDWVFVATEDALRSPGDQLPIELGGQPVLLLRDQHCELKALSNLCAHRGTLLVDKPTNGTRIQCPYHAWTYDNSGRLLIVPFQFEDVVDKSEHCLSSYRIESWHGLIFVSLNLEVEALSSRLKTIEPHVIAYEIDELHHRTDLESNDEWDCNWKIAIMNAMESYHLFKVHPDSLEPYSPTKGSYYVAGSARSSVTGGTYMERRDYRLISIPPGFVGVLSEGSLLWLATYPTGPNSCQIRTGSAFAKTQHRSTLRDIGEWLSDTIEATSIPDFLPEDKEICERVQRGMKGDFKPGQLLSVERVVRDFNHYYNWRLNGVEPPPIHCERAVG